MADSEIVPVASTPSPRRAIECSSRMIVRSLPFISPMTMRIVFVPMSMPAPMMESDEKESVIINFNIINRVQSDHRSTSGDNVTGNFSSKMWKENVLVTGCFGGVGAVSCAPIDKQSFLSEHGQG